MARIRTIKPEFWTDGNVVKLSPLARLFFIGMWNFTLCDHGHVADDPFRLKLQILPADDVNPQDLLSEIMAAGRVQRIADSSGRSFLHIKRFEDHQKIDPRWKTRCPACAQNDSLEPAETQVSLREPRRDSPELSLGRDGKGREKDLSSEPDEFGQWYARYPRKEAREAAKRAFPKARKKASLQELIEGLDRYNAAVKGKEREFIALPATWLNAGRWQDEPQEARISSGSPWDPEFHQTRVAS